MIYGADGMPIGRSASSDDVEASRITGSLYQGSAPVPHRLARAGFTHVVLCAKELQMHDGAFGATKVLRCPLDDTTRLDELAGVYNFPSSVVTTAALVADAIARRKKVLVTCAQGLNRSGIVVAATLLLLTDWPRQTIVDKMRARRSKHVLFNPLFESCVLGKVPAFNRAIAAARRTARFGE